MKTRNWLPLAALLAISLLLPESLLAVGARGGGGGRPGGGGGARPSGGGGARPSVSRPSPNISRPSPNISRPSPNISRPSPNISRPSTPNISRPSTPNISRPSTPNIARPTTPSVRPSVPNRPSTGSLPNLGGNVTNRPNLPNAGNRPSLPNDRPNLPNAGNRPNTGNPGFARPTPRPTPGGVGDFLGIPGGVRPDSGAKPAFPDRPTTLPGIADRPGRPTTLPGDIGNKLPGNAGDKFPGRPDRPTTLPGDIGNRLPGDGGNRPDRPNVPDRPGNIARPDRPVRPDRPNIDRDNIINNKPSWVNINDNKFNNINANIGVINKRPTMNNWVNNHPARGQYWNNWGNSIHCRPPYNRPWFGNSWWGIHGGPNCGWHYHYWNRGFGWNYWWRPAVWTGVTAWFQPWGWQQPVYYDYGTGGNVVYNNDIVYIDGQQVATADEYAQSAAALATVAPPETEAQAEEAEWMPLGTFAVSTSENDTEPSRVLQLAVNKQGIVSGTMFNSQTDKSYAVQGQVDKQTQRVAFRIGDSDKLVAETGIYNLTQEEAPLLVHYGTEKTETYLLKRLEEPQADAAASQDF